MCALSACGAVDADNLYEFKDLREQALVQNDKRQGERALLGHNKTPPQFRQLLPYNGNLGGCHLVMDMTALRVQGTRIVVCYAAREIR